MGWTVSREQHHSFIMQRGRSRSNSPLPPPPELELASLFQEQNTQQPSKPHQPRGPSPTDPTRRGHCSDSETCVQTGRISMVTFLVRLGGGAHDTTQGNPAANFATGTPHIDRSCLHYITNRPIWRQQLPWQPVRWRITRFDRHDMNPQEGARFVHDLVNLHHGHFWLHMTHELLTVDCLCNFRTTCRRARRCWS